ncbi:MAG: hypothetical protein ACFFDW_10470 [Candidatus Thorarchaeota archaeon]
MESEKPSLQSKIIKILRISSEPLSAHSISETYHLSYSKVKTELKILEKEKLISSISTKRGVFYFIPDKYLIKNRDLKSSSYISFLAYEDFTDEELIKRKNFLMKIIEKLSLDFQEKKVTATEYFALISEKNEEISIINQILEDRIENNKKFCYFCGDEISNNNDFCSSCKKMVERCSVCHRAIYKEDVVQCNFCKSYSHRSHILEWIKTYGFCPICKEKLKESDLL